MGDISPWMSGGASVHPAELMKALAHRYRFKAVTPARLMGGSRSQVSEVKTVRAIPYATRLLVLAEGVRFLGDVELVHVHDPRLFAVKRMLRKPLVTTFHGYLTNEAMADYHTRPGLPRYELYRRILRACVDASDGIVAVDSRIASWLSDEFKAPSVHVIPNGVDLLRFRPGRNSNAVLKTLGVPSDVPTILAAKHFTPKNGMENIVRAMPFVLKEIPSAHLILAGSGRLGEYLVSLVSALGIQSHVTLPGQIPNENMPDVIGACDVGTIPSVPVAGVEEATSILMLEMMASGKPVIASAIGGLRETIRNGETGILVEPGQPVALAQALVSTLLDAGLRFRIGNAARRYVELHHSWNAIGARVATIYDKFLCP